MLVQVSLYHIVVIFYVFCSTFTTFETLLCYHTISSKIKNIPRIMSSKSLLAVLDFELKKVIVLITNQFARLPLILFMSSDSRFGWNLNYIDFIVELERGEICEEGRRGMYRETRVVSGAGRAEVGAGREAVPLNWSLFCIYYPDLIILISPSHFTTRTNNYQTFFKVISLRSSIEIDSNQYYRFMDSS